MIIVSGRDHMKGEEKWRGVPKRHPPDQDDPEDWILPRNALYII
jgi:hypothetical protein